jgi:hypothetical protein
MPDRCMSALGQKLPSRLGSPYVGLALNSGQTLAVAGRLRCANSRHTTPPEYDA